MRTKSNKWLQVEAFAKNHGVHEWAVAKWRLRGVPTKWQIEIVRETAGAISFEDLAKMKPEE